MPGYLTCRIALPEHFRVQDVLDFHRRDVQETAERVAGSVIEKGLFWADSPARLTVRFRSVRAEVRLDVDGKVPARDRPALENMVRRMLGLTQAVEEFERVYADHAQLGPLIAAQRGLRVPQTPTPFEALTWAVTGQQISVSAAVSMRRNLIRAVNARHSGGLLCCPDAGRLAGMTEEELRGCGFSVAKARTLLLLAGLVRAGELPLDEWADTLPAGEIGERLLAVRGIGPWTVSYVLMRGFGWLDGSLHGDVALRRNLSAMLGMAEKIGEAATRAWLEEFSPWRALVAAHVWKRGSGTAAY